ncbi:MAG: hypothetical protein H6627_07820 [Calditrichae bacterium]|nr:hypothetical protein [Calditrichia bacterium]
MKLKLPVLLLFLVTISCNNEAEKQNSQIDEIITALNFDNVIGSIQQTVSVQLSSLQNAVGEKVYDGMQSAAHKAYSKDSLKVNFRKFLLTKADSLDVNSFLKWLRSPLYLKIDKAESRQLTEKDYNNILELNSKYKNDSTLSTRILYIKSALRREETELTADAYASTFRALIEANRRFVDQMHKIKESDVDFIVDTERKKFINDMYDRALVEKLYRYADLSDQELMQITDFKHSSTGKTATLFIHRAILYTVKKANLDFLYRVSRISA